MNICCIQKLEVHMHSVSTGSGYPASGHGLDRKNRSIQFQTCPKTSPTGCCRGKPGPVLVDPWVWLALARPVCSKLLFQILGFTFMVAFRYITVDRKIWTLVRHCPLSMYWLPQRSKWIDTCSLPHPENELQQSVDDCWLCILGNLEVRPVQCSHKQSFGRVCGIESKQYAHYSILNMSINGALTILGLASSVI
jgi:hypothetical protein